MYATEQDKSASSTTTFSQERICPPRRPGITYGLKLSIEDVGRSAANHKALTGKVIITGHKVATYVQDV